jgi:DNA-binding response OmpR family regulator
MKLLCLSLDEAVIRQIQEECEVQQWQVRVVAERQEFLEAIYGFGPDMLLIDVGAIEELEWWQSQGTLENKPVLFVNHELTEEFATRAFECGVDGLVPKSIFSRRMFAARVKSYLRRQGIADNRRFVPRLQLVLDSQRYRVEVQGSALGLTLTEFKILRELATDKEKVVSRREIQGQVFGSQQVSKRSLDVHICALRKKLGPYNLDIDSVRGVGYRLNPCVAS